MARIRSTGEPDPQQARIIRWMQRLGWRVWQGSSVLPWPPSARGVVLQDRLLAHLQRWRFDYKNQPHALTESGIEQVMRAVSTPHLGDGLLAASERMYGLLTMGVTVTEFMPDGHRHDSTVPLVDWCDVQRNQFDLVVDIPVWSAQGTHQRRPSMIACVNGLPLAVLEIDSDRSPRGLKEAIHRHLLHQRSDELPHLYVHAHVLVAIGSGSARYGTTGTPVHAWSRWREDFKANHDVDRPPRNAATRLLTGLLSHERLLTFVHQFILFTQHRGKLIARYPQFFAVQTLMKRIQVRRPDGAREGGVVWHTSGSGKSLCMVFLTKALLRQSATHACRVLVVTDRKDLETQIACNFIDSGMLGTSVAARRKAEPMRAGSGRELAHRIGQGHERIIFTLVHKFATAARLPACYNPSADIIVLIDEGHRSHTGALHQWMRRSMPRAAYLAFTGTPLLKQEKTAHVFGPLLHVHTWLEAVQDGTITPLWYTERFAWNRKDATAYPERDGRLAEIARDIAQHFHGYIKSKGTGLKGLLAVANKLDALRYHHHLQRTGLVKSAIVISAPDRAEGDAIDDMGMDEVKQWWDENAARQSSHQESLLLQAFGSDGGPDLLIVVDRLLIGFDEPRNTVLYIDKPLRAHSLIQAVARVNRLHAQKPYGLLVDYCGSLRSMDSAMAAYRDRHAQTQSGFEIGDIHGLYHHWAVEFQRLERLQRKLRQAMTGIAKTRSDHASWERLIGMLDRFETGLSNLKDAQFFWTGENDFRACMSACEADLLLFRSLVQRARGTSTAKACGAYPPERQHQPTDEALHEPIPIYGTSQPLSQPLARSSRLMACLLGQGIPPAMAQAMVDDVLEALGENSLSTHNAEAAIRRTLLPRLFTQLGLKRARVVLRQLMASVRP